MDNVNYLFLLLPLMLAGGAFMNYLAYGHALKCSKYDNAWSAPKSNGG